MADVHKIIDRLEHCRQTGKDRWMAKCPAHTDGTPSLSVTQLADQRILIHCHAGCGALDVLDSIGLEWSDLFPPNQNYSAATRRRERDAEQEIIAEIAEADLRCGRRLTEADKQAVIKARLGL